MGYANTTAALSLCLPLLRSNESDEVKKETTYEYDVLDVFITANMYVFVGYWTLLCAHAKLEIERSLDHCLYHVATFSDELMNVVLGNMVAAEELIIQLFQLYPLKLKVHIVLVSRGDLRRKSKAKSSVPSVRS